MLTMPGVIIEDSVVTVIIIAKLVHSLFLQP